MEPAKLKVTELRDELAARGLSTKGLKAELVARLEEYIAANGDTIPAAVEDGIVEETAAEPEKATSPRKTRGSPRKAEPANPVDSAEELKEVPKSPTRGKRGRAASEEEQEPESKKPATVDSETAATEEKIIPAPQNPVSSVLHLTNLHRPFTERQLKEFIGSGFVAFWVDDIKSQCLVQFPTTQEAESRRAALVGQVFPPETDHRVCVDFGSEARLTELLKPTAEEENQSPLPDSTLTTFFKKTTVEPAIYYLPKN